MMVIQCGRYYLSEAIPLLIEEDYPTLVKNQLDAWHLTDSEEAEAWAEEIGGKVVEVNE